MIPWEILLGLSVLSVFFLAASYTDLRTRRVPLALVILGSCGLAIVVFPQPVLIIQVVLVFLASFAVGRMRSKGKQVLASGDVAALTLLASMPGILLPIGMLAAGITGIAHHMKNKAQLEDSGYPIVSYLGLGFFVALAVGLAVSIG